MDTENVDTHKTELDTMDARVAALEVLLGFKGNAVIDLRYNSTVDVHALQINEIEARITAMESAISVTTIEDDPDIVYEEPPEPKNPPNPPGTFNPDTGANWFDLRNAIIVGESTVYDTNHSAKKIFDSPDDPYYKGTFLRSTWMSENVDNPYVIVDVRVPIKVKSVIFYHWGAQHYVQFPLMKRVPRNFYVHSGASATGPWILQGSSSYEVVETGGNHQHECLYNSITTSQFWKITVSGQEDPMCTLSEAKFMRG